MGKIFVLAITGGSGSGKTTLARALEARLGADQAVLLTEDHYYAPRARHSATSAGMSPAEVEAVVDFDDPASKDMQLFRRHIEALRRGEAVDQPVYDFQMHDRVEGQVHRVEPRPIVIVEGIHCLSAAGLRELYDLAVFVDTSADLRLARRILRDVAERGRSVESSLRQYLAFTRAAHPRFTEPARALCELVVSTDSPAEAEQALARMWSELHRRRGTS